MRRFNALLLLLLAVLVMRRTMADDGLADLRSTALAFGFALIAAALAGDLVERLRLPRLSGYLLFGLACGPYAADLISRTMASELQQINGLAIALIAFVAGLEMNLSRLRESLPRISRLGAVVLGGSFVIFTVLLATAWPWLPFPALEPFTLRAAVAGVVALLVVSFSPTVTIAVMAESRARGPLTDLVLPVVVLADLALIVAFALALQFVRWTAGTAHEAEVGLVALLSWELLGSLAFGAVVGAAFAFYLRLVGREITLVMIGLCIVLAGVGRALHFEIVLASLTAGLVVENIAPPKGDALKHAVEGGALPVLIVFFVAAGASLQLDALASVGLIALLLAAVRALVLYGTSRVGLRWAGLPDAPGGLAWMGLVSQGGVTLGLASLVAGEFSAWGPTVYTLVIALTAIHVLAGPVVFRAALARAGEVGQMGKAGH
ncbi:MAG: cation:proton antiporter [Vicinamibacterales bacterium]